ncbi:MAG: helix-turn-helix transcriptional regulator [Proteobacteria bacterium]|nr:helix-turn-helix transcriptional regulator [Pseudomonadota bacterium]
MSTSFSERLSERMKQVGMSQKAFAEALGVAEATVSRYLSGERTPSVNVVGKIARILQTTPDYLLRSASDESLQAVNCDMVNIKSLISRNAKNMSLDDKMELIRMMMEGDKDK